jgi:hypothetical protein
MKKLFLLFVACSFIGFYSCEKDKSDSIGQIQGMGKTTGDLQVKEPYTLPEGIHFIGEITGIEDPVVKTGEKKSAYNTKSGYSCYGSGYYVRLKLNLLNSLNYPRTVFFPKGLLWQCKSGNFQHGLQAQTTWVCLQPNSSRTISIDLYCVNLGIPAPDQTGTYKILGVTNSKIMWNLLDLIGWRKVNYEMIYGTLNGGKGTEAIPTYEEITEKLQTIVHNLTDNGIDITADDKAFIESIPELSSTEIPQLDVNLEYPDFFYEFVVPGK